MRMCLFRPDILAVLMRMCIENNILSDLLEEIMHMCMENDNYAIRFIGGNNAYVYGK